VEEGGCPIIWIKRWVICLSLILLMVGCAAKGRTEKVEPPVDHTAVTGNHEANLIKWTADGIISPNEYSKYQKIGEVGFYSRIEGDFACLAMVAPTTGYIVLGINQAWGTG